MDIQLACPGPVLSNANKTTLELPSKTAFSKAPTPLHSGQVLYY